MKVSAPTENERTVTGMAEYIEREALLSVVKPDDPSDEKAAITIATAKKLIRSLVYRVPNADVAPVRHGRWIYTGKYGEYECSVCRGIDANCYDYYNSHVVTEQDYCPYCGAKMDLED